MTGARGRAGRVAALDGIRGTAIALVLFAHVVGATGAGLAGVLIFFVLSGYLITSVLVGDACANGRVDLRRFYVRRFLRLVPALVMLLVLVIVMSFVPGSGVTTANAATGAWQGLLYVTDLTAGLGYDFAPQLEHLWSLAVEEQFYLVWPVMAVLLLRRPAGSRLRPMLWLIAAAVVLRMATVVEGMSLGWFFYTLPTVWVECLLTGALLAILAASARHAGWAPRSPALVTALAVVVIAGLSLNPGTYQSPLTYLVGIPVLTSAAAWVVWWASRPVPSRLRTALEWSPLRWLGDRSYALYLFNSACILVVTSYVGWTVWGRSLGAAIAIVLAMASRRFVELPALRLKDRLGDAVSRREPSTRPGPTAAQGVGPPPLASPAAGES
ncbi:hypothetical protein GCM10027053_03340 [Intrasporangium mesophilum]